MLVFAAQGSSYDAVIADMKRPPNLDLGCHWLACYVMLSRARSLDGFFVLRPASRQELAAKLPQYLFDEMERLERLDVSSLDELTDYIGKLPMDVPEEVTALLARNASEKERESARAHRSRDVSLPS